MKKKKRGPLFGLLYGVVLVCFTAYVLLDTFVIPRTYTVLTDSAGENATTSVSNGTVTASAGSGTSADDASGTSGAASSSGTASGAASSLDASSSSETTDPVITATSYSDGNITISITTYRVDNTNVYVADVQLASADALKTALAQNTYGKNVTEKTSAIASEVNAILAINGDFYGASETGYVIRNGVLLRSESAGSSQEDLVIYQDGTFGIIKEGDITAEQLLANGAQQVLSFGPALVENGQVTVTSGEEVDKAMTTNPRTAIGVIDSLHYVFVVADGRTSASTGLSLDALATFMQSTLGVTTAYNLDGGGSSTMVFEGTVVNQPTTNGNTIKERSVSDIVYIGE